MARLETQINQIYLTHPEAKNVSLVLYEETINATTHLFVVAELANLQRKAEAASLKKISEIILASFRGNKKLGAEAMFEAALSQINQNLADLAHEGTKTWVGKFSCLIAVKSGDNIYLASNGQTAAWLKRKSDMMEILPAEKRGTHPLKSFQNFTQGKLAMDDALILTTSNIFNYVSFELFTKTLERMELADACVEISKILQDSTGSDQAFASFFLGFVKKSVEVEMPVTTPAPVVAAIESPAPAIKEVTAIKPKPLSSMYAPLPEEIESEAVGASILSKLKVPKVSLPKFNFSLPKNLPGLPKISIPKINWNFGFFKRLTLAGKFFFISFSIFFILFVVNLSLYGFKLRNQRKAEKINTQVALVANDISAIGSALIYKDDQQALKLYTQAQADFDTLKAMDVTQTGQFVTKLQQLYNQVNKTSVAESPKAYGMFTHHPIYLAKTPTAFLLSGLDSNSVEQFDGTNETNYFLLNSLNQNITSVAYWAPAGIIVSVSDQIYYIDNTLKQYESLVSLSGAQIDRIKVYNNNLYALDTKNGKLYRIVSSKGKYTTSVAASGDFSSVRDFAIDKDVYLLSADHVTKISGSTASAFAMPYMTDALSNGTRIFIGTNLYILEPNKKRILVISKTGQLINQISFPTTNTPLDLYVDETARNLFILDDNVMYRITF